MGRHGGDYGIGFAPVGAPARPAYSFAPSGAPTAKGRSGGSREECGNGSAFAPSGAPTRAADNHCRSGCSGEIPWAPPLETDLPGQWRYFHTQCAHWFPLPADWRADAFRPWLLALQVGRDAEIHGDDAQRIAAVWPAHGGRPVWRRGLGAGLAWPLRRLPSLLGFAARQGWHAAWVAEEGYRRRAGKRRVLRRLVVAHPKPQTEFAFPEKGRPS
jgi:hypothetical protein